MSQKRPKVILVLNKKHPFKYDRVVKLGHIVVSLRRLQQSEYCRRCFFSRFKKKHNITDLMIYRHILHSTYMTGRDTKQIKSVQFSKTFKLKLTELCVYLINY